MSPSTLALWVALGVAAAVAALPVTLTAGILLAWSVARFADGRISNQATLALFGMTALGTLFSFYLTFLEPFVIGATCAWCLTSAIVMTVLMLLSLAPAKHALDKMEKR